MLYFLDPGFWNSPWLLVLFAVSIFIVILLRYLLLSTAYHIFFSKFYEHSARFFFRSGKRQWRREISWATFSAAIFTFLSVTVFWLYQNNHTKIYTNVSDYSVWWFILSIVILLVSYETYYYWLHRWMHLPKVFRLVHKVHHDSIHTSVFTSFSFHPLEAILQFLFLPVTLMIIPVHYYAIGIVLIIWTVSAIINHASIEIFPKGFIFNKIGKWFIGATHHDLHHKEFKTNFGLYFTFWDKWMNTESERFASRFKEVTEGFKKND